MGGNLLSSFLEKKKLNSDDIIIIHPDKNRRKHLENTFNCRTDAIDNCTFQDNDILFVGLKPINFLEKSKEIRKSINNQQPTCISIMASISCDKITENLGLKKVIRLMPNLAVKIGEGVTGIVSTKETISQNLEHIKYLLKDSGLVINLNNDEQISAITALSGSGPAFFYYFIEAMIEAGEKIGFENKVSEQIVKQTISGALKLISNEKQSISELRKKVTSKGGTTEAGLNVLIKKDFYKLISETINVAKNKAS